MKTKFGMQVSFYFNHFQIVFEQEVIVSIQLIKVDIIVLIILSLPSYIFKIVLIINYIGKSTQCLMIQGYNS